MKQLPKKLRYLPLYLVVLAIHFTSWPVSAAQLNPPKIEIADKVSIPAIVGDVTLQSPIIKIKINGQGPFLFMFDTGFSKTMISKSLAKKLNLPIAHTQNVKMTTPNQVVNTFNHVYIIPHIQIGDFVINDYEVSSSSAYEDVDESYKRLHIDGVLSASIFYGSLITLDYKHEKIHVQKGALSAKDEDVIPCRKDFPVPVIQGTIKFDKLKKEETQDFILDSGDSAFVYINMCDIPEMKNFKNQETILSYDFLERPLRTSLAELYGDVIFSKSVTLKSPYITFSAVNCENPIGLLGRKFFEKYQVTLDIKNHLVKIKPY